MAGRDAFLGEFDSQFREGILSFADRVSHTDADVVISMARKATCFVDALATVGEVVSTPGLDLAFIGPGDLATSMGHRGRTDRPEVQDALLRLEAVVRDSPVVLGGVAPTPEQANAMVARGYRALVVGFDWSLLQRGVAAALGGVSG